MNNNFTHKELASGGWQKLTLMEQLGNIGSEVSRSINWFKKNNQQYFNSAFERALELFDLSISDNRWKGRLKEIVRCREYYCSLFFAPELYKEIDKEFDSINKYFLYLGIAARNERAKVIKV